MDPTNPPRPAGFILLSQAEQLGITQKDMVDALSDPDKALPRHPVELDTAELTRQAIRTRDWSAPQRALEEQFRTKLAPVLARHPDYRIAYFGSASIPLTVLLGSWLETWQQVEVVPHHHVRRSWGWATEPAQPPARLKPVRLPEEKDRTPGEAIIRVSTSHLVDAQATRRVVPQPLVEIDLELEHPSEDAFTGSEQLREVAHAFRSALDVIGDRFPGIERVHLFASVQPGMALLLGAQISKTMHPAVQTYQYTRNSENEPPHHPAVLVNGPSRPEPVPLTPEETQRAHEDRVSLARDLERMKGMAGREKRGTTASWLVGLFPKHGKHPAFATSWRHLPPLHATPVSASKVSLEEHTVDDSFCFDQPRTAWRIDDGWLARLARRLPDASDRQRALRLLVFHELVHRGTQRLTSTSSKGIGRFPKVLEEIDYQADVWAMFHEYVLTEHQSPAEVADPRAFFLKLITLATEAMWAFDDGLPPREVQTRRFHRYLLWYWQYLMMERGAGDGRETPLETVLALLSQRPLIELAGPTIVSHNERTFFVLDSRLMNIPELAIYHEGRLFRHGERFDLSIATLLEGIRERSSARIIEVLRAAFEQTL